MASYLRRLTYDDDDNGDNHRTAMDDMFGPDSQPDGHQSTHHHNTHVRCDISTGSNERGGSSLGKPFREEIEMDSYTQQPSRENPGRAAGRVSLLPEDTFGSCTEAADMSSTSPNRRRRFAAANTVAHAAAFVAEEILGRKRQPDRYPF